MTVVDLAPLSSLRRWTRHPDRGPVGWVAVGSRNCEETCTELGLSGSLIEEGGRGLPEYLVQCAVRILLDLVSCARKPSRVSKLVVALSLMIELV